MSKISEHIIRFIMLSALQILFLNNIQISGYINPYIYILFIMLLPAKMSKALVLIYSFGIGFLMDIFSDSYGIHTSATLLMAYFRPRVLSLVSIKGGEDLEYIGIKHLRLGRFFTFVSTLTLIHHFTLFYLEAFRWNEFLDTLSRATLSSAVSLIIILCIESIRANSKVK